MKRTVLRFALSLCLVSGCTATARTQIKTDGLYDAFSARQMAIVSTSSANEKTQAVVIRFRATVGDKPFDCGGTYEGIGTTRSNVKVTDFRFFVSNVRLVDARGKESAVSLSNDGKWQNDKVALVAFENGQGWCGTDQTNMEVTGTAESGSYVGLRFSIGVPLAENHLDPATAPSPLNLTRMFWSWNAGYKFIRLEMSTTGQPRGYVLHLGSTDCKAALPGDNSTTLCSFENRPDIYLAQFNQSTDVVNVDLKALYEGVNVDVNQEQTGEGCMSSQRDLDCAGVFKNLGLAFGGVRPGEQSFMRARRFVKNDGKASN